MSVAAPARVALPAVAPPAIAVAAPANVAVLRALVRRGLLDNRRAPLVWGARSA